MTFSTSSLWHIVAILTPLVTAETQPKVLSFSPSGETKKVSQVVVKFSEPIVPMGDPRVENPFEIACPEKGSGRWLDTSIWAYDFGKELEAGIQCSFKIKSTFKTVKGSEIGGTKEFAFSTGGPALLRTSPYEGSEYLSEDQYFILHTDSPVNRASLQDRVFFAVDGIEDKIPVEEITGKERDRVLKAEGIRKSDEKVIVIRATQNFPVERKVRLIWSKGVLSETNVATNNDQVMEYRVRRAFTVEFNCSRENKEAPCLPFSNMSLNFSRATQKSFLEKITMKSFKGKVWKAKLSTSDTDKSETSEYVTFEAPFPENEKFTITLPSEMIDETGEKLSNQAKFPLKVATGGFPPLAKFSGRFGVLEAKNALLPVTVRNLEKEVKTKFKNTLIQGKTLRLNAKSALDVFQWIKKVEHADREKPVLAGKTPDTTFNLPRSQPNKAFEVVGIPMKKPGFYVVELESNALGEALLANKGKFYVPTTVLVTNMAMHLKWGRESSLVWVTALDTGAPVEGASVEIFNCKGKSLFKGRSGKAGALAISSLPRSSELPNCKEENDHHWSPFSSGMFLMASKGGDTTFLHSSWNQGIESWRFKIQSEWNEAPYKVHTVLDRSLFRVGETVHMQHILRRHSTKGLLLFPENKKPKELVITHTGTDEKYTFPIKAWSKNHFAESTWKIPDSAKRGHYRIQLLSYDMVGKKKVGSTYYDSTYFRVEDFRVPLMKGAIQGPKEVPVAPSEFPLDLGLQYFSGGPAANEKVIVRSRVGTDTSLTFSQFPEWFFANGFVESSRKRYDDDEESRGSQQNQNKMASETIPLDKNGFAKFEIKDLPKTGKPFQLSAEMEYRDPNGEVQTISQNFNVVPSDRLVALKVEDWTMTQEKVSVQAAVSDRQGNPVPNTEVKIQLWQRKNYSHRKRMVGGFYSYENWEEVSQLADFCTTKTNSKGLALCENQSPVSGNVIFQARLTDNKGRESAAHTEVWVAGTDDWWFSGSDNDRMDVIPENRKYNPGQKARFQVRMPFRKATALIAVEREGVMDFYVKEISGKNPSLEIPVKPNYAPNVYVSVLAVRGRVGDVKPTALLDLGKPAYKLGIGEIQVGWQKYELNVDVKADKEIYRAREKVKAEARVKLPDGTIPKRGEITFAVVDEALLDLQPNHTWNVLEALLTRRGYAIENATMQMHVIGKRHFGLKALPSGGGGGRGNSTRELFDTLIYWKTSVPLDKDGAAKVEFPLNDSLSSFRIVAVANVGVERFGLSQTSVRTTQDLMLFSGVPPVARAGDEVIASLTVRNTTAQKLDVNTGLTWKDSSRKFSPQVVELPPNESRQVMWKVKIPEGATSLTYEFNADAGETIRDRVRVTQSIIPVVLPKVYQATLMQVEGKKSLPVEIPRGASRAGGIKASVSSSLIGSNDSVKEFFKTYPFSCLEQEISRSIGLNDSKRWQALMARLPSYLDSSGFAKYFPSSLYGSEVLSAYLISIAHEKGWAIPDESRARVMTALRGFLDGTLRPQSLSTADLTLRKLKALEAVARQEGEAGVEKWLSTLTIEPNLWPTSGVVDWLSIMKRASSLKERDKKMAEAHNIIRTRLNWAGTSLKFSDEGAENLWWLMSSADETSARSILALIDSMLWKDELPKLMKGFLARKRQGRWDLTTANAWGALSVEKFATAFEKEKVSGGTSASLGKINWKFDWKKEVGEKLFPWPSSRGEFAIDHQGTGKPWLVLQSIAAIPLREPLWSGMRIDKTITPVIRKEKGKWSVGDVVKVNLKMRSDADSNWVVIEDPIPTGATILGSGLGRDSQLTQFEGESAPLAMGNWVTAEERTFRYYRGYYEWVNRGEFEIEYRFRLNNPGIFQMPSTRLEAMYQPELFGELPNAKWNVEP